MTRKKAFSLIELLVATALGMLLVLGLMSLLTSVIKSYHSQQDSQALYDEATTLTHLWQNAFSAVGDFPGPQNRLPRAIFTSTGIKIYSVQEASSNKILPTAVVKKLLPHSQIIVAEQVVLPLEHMQYDVMLKKFYVDRESDFKAGDEVLVANAQTKTLMKIASVRRQKSSLYLDLPLTDSEQWRIAHWQTSIWFAMQNETGGYGIYRLLVPEEKSPVEFVRHVTALDASVDHKFLIAKVRFEKDQQFLLWPIVVPFMQPAFGWRIW